VPILHVRRTGNSLALLVPKDEARTLDLHEGDKVQVEIRKVPDILEFAGRLKGRVSAAELHRLTDEGEELG
jgi:antitoxin component of MazEF toxin-antitoxin module